MGDVPDAAYAASRGPDPRLAIEYREHAPHVTKLAYVSWAYLLAFAEFGYAYVLAPAAQVVRRVLVSGRDAELGRAYCIRWSDPTGGSSEPISILRWAGTPPGSALTFLSLGARIGGIGVLLPPASDGDGSTYTVAEQLLDGDETDRLLPVPFWEWFGVESRDFLASRCDLWLRSATEVKALVHTTPEQAAALLREPLPPDYRPRRARRVPTPSPIVPPLPTTLDVTTWPAFAIRVITDWWRASSDSKTHNLVLSTDPAGVITAAEQIAPAYLVLHIKDIQRTFGAGAPEDEAAAISATSAMDLALEWGRARGATISDLVVTDEILDAERGVGQAWLRCQVDGTPVLVGPFYTVRTLLEAVVPVLDEWLSRETPRSDNPGRIT